MEWKSHIVLACITCEKVILFTTEDEDLRAKAFDNGTVNLFLPTVCFSCDKAERKKVADGKSDKEITMTMWTSLSISRDFIQTWQPYLAMKAFLEGILSTSKSPESSVSLVQRDNIRDMIGPHYKIQSAVVNPSTGVAAEVHPYLQSGFF